MSPDDWTPVAANDVTRMGLMGYPRATIRYSNGCVYMTDEDGNWYELQVPPLPKEPA